MDNLILILVNFVQSKLDTLAIKVEEGVDKSQLLSSGFVLDNGYFIITKEKAIDVLENTLMKDYINHWKWERNRYNG